MRDLIRLIRPKQWSKNLLVFAAYLFTARYGDAESTKLVLIAFASMCGLSSATYIFNDIFDVNRDKNHPVKKNRPIASGRVSIPAAAATGAVLLVASYVGFWYLGLGAIIVATVYICLQVMYNAGLKRVAVADVFTITLGFVLRAIVGAVAIHVAVSGWLLFCTGALALMLGFAKRRNEFVIQGDQIATSRESLVAYSRQTLDAFVLMFATGASMCYGLYCLESPTAKKYPALILTMPFVVYGISRYLLVVYTTDEGGEPADLLFRDKHLLVSILGFVVCALLAMSGMSMPVIE